MLAVCTYSLEMCGAKEIVDVIDNHQFALIKRKGRWEVLESAIQKRAQEAIRESEDRFRSLFASMSEGVALHELVYDADGRAVDYRIVDAIPAFEANTSIPVEESRGGAGEPALRVGGAAVLRDLPAGGRDGRAGVVHGVFPAAGPALPGIGRLDEAGHVRHGL